MKLTKEEKELLEKGVREIEARRGIKLDFVIVLQGEGVDSKRYSVNDRKRMIEALDYVSSEIDGDTKSTFREVDVRLIKFPVDKHDEFFNRLRKDLTIQTDSGGRYYAVGEQLASEFGLLEVVSASVDHVELKWVADLTLQPGQAALFLPDLVPPSFAKYARRKK